MLRWIFVLSIVCFLTAIDLLKVSIVMASSIELLSKTTTWTIQPERLRISAKPAGHDSMEIAEGFADAYDIENLTVEDSSAGWLIPNQELSMDVKVIDDSGLQVFIQTTRHQEFEWRLTPMFHQGEELIWASGEGCIIPVADAFWRNTILSHTWDTTESLSVPVWGVRRGDITISWFVDSPFRNTFQFDLADRQDRLKFTHDFHQKSPETSLLFQIHLDENASPVQPALHYRHWLQESGRFLTLEEKQKKTPNVDRLRGAIHAYLWGDQLVSQHDIDPKQWKSFCQQLVSGAENKSNPIAALIHQSFSAEQWEAIVEASKLDRPYVYLKRGIAEGLSQLLASDGLSNAPAWTAMEKPQELQNLFDRRDSLPVAERVLLHAKLLRLAFPDVFIDPRDWGNGVSMKMLRKIHETDIDRIKLCTDGWAGIEKRPWVAKQANEYSWLIGTYDGYHSVHDPKTKGTDDSWPTAQMTQELFEDGSVINSDGSYNKGFKGIGRKLNSIVGRPFVEERIGHNMKRTPFSYYFLDCDATGEVYDDYHPKHSMSLEEDAAARCDRMEWVAETYHAVVGTEGGNSYAVNSFHVAEGIFGPFFGWGDEDMKDPNSKYYRGRYYPPEAPEVMMKPVPIKDRFWKSHYDPKYRVPLHATVYHDAAVVTHHWSNAHFKYPEIRHIVALTEVLYLCPPMYHLNLDEFDRRKDIILEHYKVWSPLHRRFGFHAMTEFRYSSRDRLVQQTRFGSDCRIIVNFGDTAYETGTISIPPHSAWIDAQAIWDRPMIYTPTVE